MFLSITDISFFAQFQIGLELLAQFQIGLQVLAQFQIGLELLKLLLFVSSLWLIFLILIQRGKGGGLSAALGGGGGDSAFGAKAGDAFTKITVISALVWIGLCMVTIARYNPPERSTNRFMEDDEEYMDEEATDMSSMVPSVGAAGVGEPSTESDSGSSSMADDADGSLEPAGGLEPAGDLEPADSTEPATTESADGEDGSAAKESDESADGGQ